MDSAVCPCCSTHNKSSLDHEAIFSVLELIFIREKLFHIIEKYVKMQVSMRVSEQISTLKKKIWKDFYILYFQPQKYHFVGPLIKNLAKNHCSFD